MDHLGLEAALRRYVREFSERTGIEVDLSFHLRRPLSQELEIVIYRVVQEALTNVARHSGSPKAAVDQELLDAVLAVARGERYLNPSLAMRLAMEMVREEEGALSPREEEMLRLLAQGLSHKEVAEQLGISEKTVATYRERGMEKLGLKSRSDLLRYAVKRGWFRGPA